MFSVIPLTDLPEVQPGDPLESMLAEKLATGPDRLQAGDVLVVAQKVVSKAENRYVSLTDVIPSAHAKSLAQKTGKDAALVELVLQESDSVVRHAPNILIVRHRLGHVMANAGIDASNIGRGHAGKVLLLPVNPDASAERIAEMCRCRTGVKPGVVISDSFGRPWRMGTVNVALGVAGMAAIIDQRGTPDRDGRKMQVTQIALADAVAGAAGLVIGEGAEGIPAAIVRGLRLHGPSQSSQALLRPLDQDLFR